jgi:hypothetical protein
MTMTSGPWIAHDPDQARDAADRLHVWPLDESNAALLNEVHPVGYTQSHEPHEVYDLIAVGAGAGGLVSAKQVSSWRCRVDSRRSCVIFLLMYCSCRSRRVGVPNRRSFPNSWPVGIV